MATESSFNPIPIVVHVIAIAIGIFFGLRAMDTIAPELPAEAVEPGVESAAAAASVAGDDPGSLFREVNLAPALDQLAEQVPAGEGFVTLRIEPGSLSAETADAEGTFELDQVSAATPAQIAEEVRRERAAVSLADLGYMELVATDAGPRWYVQLDINRTDVSPPWTYGAPLDGTPVEVGGPPPNPIVAP
jgi:hypothetical protein